MLSVVLATHNEEKNIQRCLASVEDIADEIIVVDGESKDNTVKIAKQFKVKVIKTTNKANFHINKQIGMDKAQGDLVLQLDADEVVDNQLSKFIKKLHKKVVDQQTMKHSAWWIKRKNYFFGKFLKKGGQYPDPVIRLYLKGKAHLPQKDVHEQMEVDGSVGTAKGHLLHYSNPTLRAYFKKFNTYTSFKAQQLADDHQRITILNSIRYLVTKPSGTFLSLFIRHKGFLDGLAGFLFAFFSGLHHSVSYIKLWEIYQLDSNDND